MCVCVCECVYMGVYVLVIHRYTILPYIAHICEATIADLLLRQYSSNGTYTCLLRISHDLYFSLFLLYSIQLNNNNIY